MPSKVGFQIRRARQEAGIGLRELARRIDKSPAYLVALELADEPPGITEATLSAIAKELGLNSDLLMTLASKFPAAVRPKTPLEVELYRMVRQLPAERQRALLESLKHEKGWSTEAQSKKGRYKDHERR